MLPRVCVACGEQISRPVPENVNVCEACFLGEPEELMVADEVPTLERGRGIGDEVHPARRRSLAVGDHSHERKTPPSMPRRRH